MAVAWEDPDFDAEQMAFYYVRAIEVPTLRRSLYDAVALGIDVGVTEQPAIIQERVLLAQLVHALRYLGGGKVARWYHGRGSLCRADGFHLS